MYKNFSAGTLDELEDKLDDFVGQLETGQLISVSSIIITISGVYRVSCEYKENKETDA